MEDWNKKMQSAIDCASFFAQCDVIDLDFVNGLTREVHVAIDPSLRQRGYDTAWLDLDGLLLYFNVPTYIPLKISSNQEPVEIAWYSEDGTLLRKEEVNSEEMTFYMSKPFSYIYKAPVNTIPNSDLKVKNAR